MAHIRQRLPALKSKVSLLVLQTEQELTRYGDPIFTTGKGHQGALLLQILTRFASDFGGSIDGGANATVEITRHLYFFLSYYSKDATSMVY